MPEKESFPTFMFRLTLLMVEYRWLFVIPVILPLSLLFSLYWKLRDFYVRSWLSFGRTHQKTVAGIQEQVRTWRNSGSSKLLCSARPSWLQLSMRDNFYKRQQNAIEMPLYDIGKLDVTKKTVTVEAYVNVGQLTQFLIKRGWTTPIVPELDDLTIGGLFLGYGIEGSSHKYGLFSDIVVSCDVIMSDGSLLHCSASENADLFHALPWSHGSLGFLVSLELQVIPCLPWVRLTYEPVFGMDTIVKRFAEVSEAERPHEFVECLMYGKDRAVLMYGDYAEKPKKDGVVNPIGKWYKPWFYKHVEGLGLQDERTVEYLPLRDYYHRHTRSIFWEAELIIPWGNHVLFRYLLGWLMPPKVSFLKLTQGKLIREYYKKKHVVQDFLLPMTELKKTLEYAHEAYGTYPIWLCPHLVKKTEPQGFLRAPINNKESEMYVDVGFYGVPRPVLKQDFDYDAVEATKRFEEFLVEIRGYQTLHADINQSPQLFRKMFSHDLYDKMRKKYNCEGAFMDIYDKVKGS